MENWFTINLPEKESKELKEKIEHSLQEKIHKKQFTQQDIDDLAAMKLDILPDPQHIRPFFLKQILPEDSLFYLNNDYNVTPDLLWYSSSSQFLSKIRKKLQPVVKLFANLEALIHKQAVYNEKQVAFNSTLVHHLRLIHNLIHNLTAELTKLKLEHEELKLYAQSLENQLNFYKEYQKTIDSILKNYDKSNP